MTMTAIGYCCGKQHGREEQEQQIWLVVRKNGACNQYIAHCSAETVSLMQEGSMPLETIKSLHDNLWILGPPNLPKA